MALVDNTWYVNFGDGATTGYYALTAWSNHTAVAGEIIRQLTTPAVGSERVFVCTTAGATGAVEPTWVNTRGALNTSSVAIYQECTGIAALNGDATNTPSWTITATPPGGVKNTAVTLGQVIKRDSGASYQICTTAGTAGNGAEPAFSNTAGTTTADNTVTWTSLGVVGNFTGWQAPHARLASVLTATWAQAGNTVYVRSNHAETQSTALSISFNPGAGTVNVLCTSSSDTALPPTTTATTATVTTTGNSNITILSANNPTVSINFDGITFNCGTGANNTTFAVGTNNSSNFQEARFKNCTLALVATGSTAKFNFGPSASCPLSMTLDNTILSFAAAGQTINICSPKFLWRNTASAVAGTVPTTLFTGTQAGDSVVDLIGVDTSALGSGKTVFGGTNFANIRARLIDCKLGASVTVASTPNGPAGAVDVIRGDSSATNYRHERYWYSGTQTVETTIIRTGGATDGTTTLAWKFVTTANSRFSMPFESLPISIWNDSTSAITTLTIYGTTTGGGVPNNDDIWVEVEYLGSSATPQGSLMTTTKADNLAASVTTNNSSDASTWGGSGAGNGFKIVVPSFTPGMKGPLNITIKVAKASTTYYIDPKPVVN